MNSLNVNGMGNISAPMINDSSISEKDLQELREKFVEEYSKMKGWDPKNLTNEQLFEIRSDKRWSTPGLLLS